MSSKNSFMIMRKRLALIELTLEIFFVSVLIYKSLQQMYNVYL